MTKKRLFNKVITGILAFTMSLSSLPAIDIFASTSNIGAKVGDVITIDTREGNWLNWGYNGKVYNSKVDYGTFNDGKGGTYQNASYCIEPSKAGVSTEGAYDVTLQDFDDDRLRAIFLSGYPNKKPEELGLSSTEQAFYATKMAIDTYLTAGLEIEEWTPNTSANSSQYSTQVVNAIKKIYKDGMDYNVGSLIDYEYAVEQTSKIESSDGKIITEIFKVITNPEAEGSTDVNISLSGDIPAGTKLTDKNGNVKSIFALGEEFKITYTLPEGKYSDRTFNFNVVGGVVNTSKLYKGVPSNSSVQSYAVYPQWHEINTTHHIVYKNTELDEKETGKLVIYKYENGTRIPLEGAKFEFRGLNNEISNIYTTNSSGTIAINDIPDGNYVLKEVQAPKNYVIDYDFPLNVKIDSTSYPNGQEITIHNKKIPSMQIYKVDGKTGKPLVNATFEIASKDGSEKTTVTTGADGKADFQPPYIGWYTVKEVVAPEGYLLGMKKIKCLQSYMQYTFQDLKMCLKKFEKL